MIIHFSSLLTFFFIYNIHIFICSFFLISRKIQFFRPFSVPLHKLGKYEELSKFLFIVLDLPWGVYEVVAQNLMRM